MINRVEQVSTSNDFYDFITQKFSDGVNLVESVSNDLTKEIEEETGYLIGGSQYFDLEKNESVAVFSMQKNIDREHSHWVNPKYDKVVRISSSPYSDRKENIEHKSIESAKDAYDRAIQNDWLVVRADIPKMLKFGWLEVRGSGTTSATTQTISLNVSFVGNTTGCKEPVASFLGDNTVNINITNGGLDKDYQAILKVYDKNQKPREITSIKIEKNKENIYSKNAIDLKEPDFVFDKSGVDYKYQVELDIVGYKKFYTNVTLKFFPKC